MRAPSLCLNVLSRFGRQPWHKLALLGIAQQDLFAVRAHFMQALDASDRYLRQEVFGLSEKRLDSFLDRLRAQEMDIYALARAHPDNPSILHLLLSAEMFLKGRSVTEVATTSQIIYRHFEHADREAFERLRTLRAQLATLSLTDTGKLSSADYPQRLKALAEEGDKLERALARRSETFRNLHLPPPPHSLVSSVAAVLPKDGALIEFVAYPDRPLFPKPGLPPSQADSSRR